MSKTYKLGVSATACVHATYYVEADSPEGAKQKALTELTENDGWSKSGYWEFNGLSHIDDKPAEVVEEPEANEEST